MILIQKASYLIRIANFCEAQCCYGGFSNEI